MAKYDFNLIVIGGGSAGLVSAIVAAGAKAKVALVEKHRMGGDCLNTGCVPSKALIRSASFLRDAKRCADLGFKSAAVDYDFAAVMERVDRVIKRIEPHDSVERFTKEGVDCFQGEAKINSPHEVQVGEQVLTTRAIAVCAGARPFVPPVKNIENAPVYTSDTIWDIRERPRRMIVLGGGPIGSELAQAFAYLDIDITLVQSANRLLPREDPEAGKLVADAMHDAGVTVMLGTKAQECRNADGAWTLVCEGAGGGLKEIPFDALLVAAGRTPNASNLPGLVEAGVALDKRGAIKVDEYLRTSVPGIYACGDIIGSYQFTHTAGHAGFFCALNALAAPFFKLKVDWSVVPWCTFTHPEVARAGMSEDEAKAGNVPYEVHTYGIDDLDRAIADEEAKGFVKLLVAPQSKGRILGVTIVGHHAGDLLHEYVVAMRNGLGLNHIINAIHVYPTLAEANKFAASTWKKAQISPRLIDLSERFARWRRGG